MFCARHMEENVRRFLTDVAGMATLTWNFLSQRKPAMKSGSRPRRPASCKSFKMPNFQVVSYAFSRSKNIAVAYCFWIKASRIKDSKRTSWSVVLRPLRKPLCMGVIILFLSRYQTSLLLTIRSITLQTQLVRAMGR